MGVTSKKLEYGHRMICHGVPSFPCFRVGGWSYSNLPASTVKNSKESELPAKYAPYRLTCRTRGREGSSSFGSRQVPQSGFTSGCARVLHVERALGYTIHRRRGATASVQSKNCPRKDLGPSCPCRWSNIAAVKAATDHINIRISQTMLSGIPLILCLGTRM